MSRPTHRDAQLRVPASLSTLSDDELRQRLAELQFMGTQYGLCSVDPPPELDAEWHALEAEQARRARPAS